MCSVNFINSIELNINKALKNADIKTRPNTSTGFWITTLLPLAICIPLINSPEILTYDYKMVSLLAATLFLSNIIFIIHCIRYNDLKITGNKQYIWTILISFLFYKYFQSGISFSLYSGIFGTVAYYKGLPFILQALPSSFSFGEAALLCQGTLLFFYASVINIFRSIFKHPTHTLSISTLILQVGIIGLGIIMIMSYISNFLKKPIPFYILVIFVVTFFVISPLHILLDGSPVLWIFQLLTNRTRSIYIILFWIVCCALAMIVINCQIRKGRKANSVTRKTFHILAVAVYLVGLIEQCSVLYLASGIVFALFVVIEMLRILNLPPLGSHLQDGFVVFADEKDAGNVALTPLYLLAGCSLPLWIHPDSCDVTDTAGFHLLPMLSGILSVGVGDTLASAVGIWLGKHKWSGTTNKTIEGSMACILSQLAFIYILIESGYIINNTYNIAKSFIAVAITSLIEAKTDQVDNIVLPLVMYIILY